MNQKLIYEKIKDLIPKDKIDALYLFGSYSNGTFTEAFDIWFEKFNEWLASEWWFIEMCINEGCGLNE